MHIQTVTADRIEQSVVNEIAVVLDECANLTCGRREKTTWVLSPDQVQAITAEIGCTRITRLALRQGGWTPVQGDSDAWQWRHKYPFAEKPVVLENIEDLALAVRDLDPRNELGLDR